MAVHLVIRVRPDNTVPGDGNVVLIQVFYCQFIEGRLSMPEEVFKMGGDYRWSLRDNVGHDGLLVIGPGFPFNDRDCSFRACADTGTEPIAEKVAYQSCFSLNQLQCSLRTIRDALAASRTLFLVDMNDLSFMAFSSGKFFAVYVFFFFSVSFR